jgi:chromosome segregation ATPase
MSNQNENEIQNEINRSNNNINNIENNQTPNTSILNVQQNLKDLSVHSLNKSSRLSVKCDEKTYLKFRNDELNKDVLDKMTEIHALKGHIKTLEAKNNNYKKNFQVSNSKLAEADTLKADINILNKKISDLECELNFSKVENMRMMDILHNKETLISQFQNLVGITESKFKLFEETNKSIRDENLILKNQIEDLNIKLNSYSQKEIVNQSTLEDLQNKVLKKQNEIEKLETDFLKKEENLKKKNGENEIYLKARMKTREEEIKNEYFKEITKVNSECDKLLLENEKLKLENKNLFQKIDDFENTIQDKEIEFKRSIDTKDLEYEKLVRSLKELQREIKQVEICYKEKVEHFKKKNKDIESENENLRKQIHSKDKATQEFQNQINEMNKCIEELTSGIREGELQIDEKEMILSTLTNEKGELLKELNKRESTKEKVLEKFEKEIESLNKKIKMVEREKEILFKEKQEDHDVIIDLRNKLSQYYGLYNHKFVTLEKEKEDSIDKHTLEYATKLQAKEDHYLNEVSRLQNIILERDKEKDGLKCKFDKKTHQV